jgi:hypothetical protein
MILMASMYAVCGGLVIGTNSEGGAPYRYPVHVVIGERNVQVQRSARRPPESHTRPFRKFRAPHLELSPIKDVAGVHGRV